MPRTYEKFAENYLVMPSVMAYEDQDKQFFYAVWRNPESDTEGREYLITGWSVTFDHAIRAVRNFMKNNQNAIYG
jgi:hypothetical protein